MPSPQSTYEFSTAVRPLDLDGKVVSDSSGFARVSVGGELDLASAPKLGEALFAVPNGTAVVILDLRELTFMDSTGLCLILSATARLAEAGCRLALIPGSGQVQRILELTRTTHDLELVAAPNAGDPAIVPSRSAAFLRARFRLWLKADYVPVGTKDQPALASSQRHGDEPSSSRPPGESPQRVSNSG